MELCVDKELSYFTFTTSSNLHFTIDIFQDILNIQRMIIAHYFRIYLEDDEDV